MTAPSPVISPFAGATATTLQRFESANQARDIILAKLRTLHQRLAIMPGWDTEERLELLKVASYFDGRLLEVTELVVEVRAEFSQVLSAAKNRIAAAATCGTQ